MEREPCPWRLVEDAGGAFVFGMATGSIWHFFGGYRNAPKGHKIEQAISRVKVRVPVLAGGFAVWGVCFSVVDCTLVHFRKKEDHFNAILAGFFTGGILAFRAGPKAMARNAFAGGAILAAIEGLQVVLSRVLLPMMQEKEMSQQRAVVDNLEPPVDPLRAYSRRKNQNNNSLNPLWQPSNEHLQYNTNGSLSAGSTSGYTGSTNSKGFDLNAVDDFDRRGEVWENKQNTASESNSEKPFWKIW